MTKGSEVVAAEREWASDFVTYNGGREPYRNQRQIFVNAGEKLRRDPSVGRKGRRPEDDGGRCGERGHHDPEVERIGVKGVSFASRGFRSWCPTP
jgi:hypothetical protein